MAWSISMDRNATLGSDENFEHFSLGLEGMLEIVKSKIDFLFVNLNRKSGDAVYFRVVDELRETIRLKHSILFVYNGIYGNTDLKDYLRLWIETTWNYNLSIVMEAAKKFPVFPELDRNGHLKNS